MALLHIECRWRSESPEETRLCAVCGDQIWMNINSLEVRCRLGEGVNPNGIWAATGIFLCDACKNTPKDVNELAG